MALILIYSTQDLSCGTVFRLITCEENNADNPIAALTERIVNVAIRQTNSGSTI